MPVARESRKASRRKRLPHWGLSGQSGEQGGRRVPSRVEHMERSAGEETMGIWGTKHGFSGWSSKELAMDEPKDEVGA